MNKVIKKTLDGLEMLKDTYKEVEVLYKILLNEKTEEFLNCDFFLNNILDKYVHLSIEEKGYLFTLIQIRNTQVEDLKENNPFFKEYAKDLGAFLSKKNKKNQDYIMITNKMMLMGMDDAFIEAFVFYQKSKEEKVEEKKGEIILPIIIKEEKEKVGPSRTKLRKRLNELAQEGFSYQDYKELLQILNLLGFKEEIALEILNKVFEHAKKDNRYYDYILKKLICEGRYDKNIEEIIEYLFMYSLLDVKERNYIFQELLTICENMKDNIKKSPRYDKLCLRALRK